jgi:arylsulfatase A-like enzyme
MRHVAVLAALLFAVPVWGGTTASRERPNILFILMDDLRWDALGATGHPFVRTPAIDRLAREGVIYRNAFVTLPLCSPARACFLTGQYSHANGIFDNSGRDTGHGLRTFPQLLRAAGYETAYIGKWHMGNDDTPRPGYDYWAGLKGQGTYFDPTLNIDGKVEKQVGYVSDILTSKTLEFLAKPHEKPWAIYLGHKAVHGPFTPAPRHADLYSAEPIERRPNVRTRTGAPPNRPRQSAEGAGPGEALIRNQLRCMASVDEGVGAIVDELQRRGMLDNTLIVFTSDNGYYWGEHGRGDKRGPHEESIRIPLIIRYPGATVAGSEVTSMVLSVDIPATILDAAGVDIPPDMHGVSLAQDAPARDAALFEYFKDPGYPHPAWLAVRTDRYKFVTYPGLDGSDELYDLEADPYEMTNRISEAEMKPVRDDLQRRMQALIKETGPVRRLPENDPSAMSATLETTRPRARRR